jgi:uncharacterized membrane protein
MGRYLSSGALFFFLQPRDESAFSAVLLLCFSARAIHKSTCKDLQQGDEHVVRVHRLLVSLPTFCAQISPLRRVAHRESSRQLDAYALPRTSAPRLERSQHAWTEFLELLLRTQGLGAAFLAPQRKVPASFYALASVLLPLPRSDILQRGGCVLPRLAAPQPFLR